MTVRKFTPTSHSSTSVSASRRAGLAGRELETADGQLLDQNRRASAEAARKHEAQVTRNRYHFLQQGDDVAGDGQLLDRGGELAVLDPVSGQPQRKLAGYREIGRASCRERGGIEV